jgi:hypothetical protein
VAHAAVAVGADVDGEGVRRRRVSISSAPEQEQRLQGPCRAPDRLDAAVGDEADVERPDARGGGVEQVEAGAERAAAARAAS